MRCPKCGAEGAYRHYQAWVCPNCGYSWVE